jgi:hypothetical protein
VGELKSAFIIILFKMRVHGLEMRDSIGTFRKICPSREILCPSSDVQNDKCILRPA